MIFYYSIGKDTKTTYAYELSGGWDVNRRCEQEHMSEIAAMDFFNNHDGWEYGWPVPISIHDGEDGPVLRTFMVEMEAEPTFYCDKEVELDE